MGLAGDAAETSELPVGRESFRGTRNSFLSSGLPCLRSDRTRPRLEQVAQQTGHSQVQLALAWALRRGTVTVLVGGRHPTHLDQALAAVKFRDHAALASLDGNV